MIFCNITKKKMYPIKWNVWTAIIITLYWQFPLVPLCEALDQRMKDTLIPWRSGDLTFRGSLAKTSQISGATQEFRLPCWRGGPRTAVPRVTVDKL